MDDNYYCHKQIEKESTQIHIYIKADQANYNLIHALGRNNYQKARLKVEIFSWKIQSFNDFLKGEWLKFFFKMWDMISVHWKKWLPKT